MHACICELIAMHIREVDFMCNMTSFTLCSSLQNTCYQFWPAAEGGTLNVGQKNVTLLKKMMNSDFVN